MTLLHQYQDGTSYREGRLPAGDPSWRRGAPARKSYAAGGAGSVALARPTDLPEADLWEVVRSRRSRREFAAEPIGQGPLFALLWAGQGITRAGAWPLRAAPSAGALYPVETYLAAARVEDLAPGLYHWELPEERLALVAAREDVGPAACRACLDQEMVAEAAAVFLWTAVWARSARKYGDRALRYAYLDAGHIGQNVHLAAEALGLGACMIGAFYDDRMNALVGVDGREESVLYAACVGVPRA
jgi:SagB-type dehydrogenase family enzyme